MKTFLKALAWFGLFLFALFVLWAGWTLSDMLDTNSWWQGRLQGVGVFRLFMITSSIGLPFMLIGGLIAKPRYFWLATIILSLFYLVLHVIYSIAVLNPPWNEKLARNTYLWAGGIPAYISIIEGIILKIIEDKQKLKLVWRKYMLWLGISTVVLCGIPLLILSDAKTKDAFVSFAPPTIIPTITPIHVKTTITYPKNGDILYVGDNVTITWTSDLSEQASYRVILYDEKKGMDYLLGVATNTGAFPWKVTDQFVGKDLWLQMDPINPSGDDNNYNYGLNVVHITIVTK